MERRLAETDSATNMVLIFMIPKWVNTNYCAIPGNYGYKWPRLEDLYRKLFGRNFAGAHDAMSDIQATKECFFEQNVGESSKQIFIS